MARLVRSLSLWSRLFATSRASSSSPWSASSSSAASSCSSRSSGGKDECDKSSTFSDTIPASSDASLDAELGEAMAATGADLSTPGQQAANQSEPSSFTALEIDESGQHAEREYSPQQLARRFGLHPRDMRFLDPSLRNLPSLLVRREVIIVNLELFKAIISAKEVLMFDPWYPHVQSVVPLMKDALQRLHTADQQQAAPAPSTATPATSSSSSSPSPSAHRPSSDDKSKEQGLSSSDISSIGSVNQEREHEGWIEPGMPFEFIALELILMTVTRTLESRFEVYNTSLSPLLSSSASTLNEGSTLMHLLQLKNGLTSFEVVLEETSQAIRSVLSDDADMLDMFLTMKSQGQIPRIEEHGEIEVLLETYLRKVDELENEVKTNVKSISLTEEHIQIRLDTMRNAMMKVDLLFNICTFAVATSALIASAFGMNLTSHMEHSPYAFYVASGVMVLLCWVLVRKGLRICKEHKIDLFHVEPEEPKLRLPVTVNKKHKRRISPVHRVKLDEMGGGGWYDRTQWWNESFDQKIKQLEEMRAYQAKMAEQRGQLNQEWNALGKGGWGGHREAGGTAGRLGYGQNESRERQRWKIK